jgi:acyl carrier protein
MSANDNVSKGVRSYQQMGIYPITVESALADLGRIMTLNAVNVLALPVDWTRFAQSLGDAAPPRVFEQLIPKREEATEAKTESIRIELEAIEPVRRRRLLETHLTEKLAAVLKTDAARIDPAKPFGLLGVDSLMALELVRRLAVTTGLRLRPVVVFNYPTVQALAREIAKRMGMALEEATTAVAPRQMQDSSPVGVALEALTEEDAIAALMGKDGAGR